MKFLSPKIHGVLDYLTSALFFVAPLTFLAGAPAIARITCFAVGGALLLVSLITRYPLGALKLIPFPTHGAIEFLAALALVAFPWLGGFGDLPLARNFFVVAGAGVLLLWLVTDYKLASQDLTRPEYNAGRRGDALTR